MFADSCSRRPPHSVLSRNDVRSISSFGLSVALLAFGLLAVPVRAAGESSPAPVLVLTEMVFVSSEGAANGVVLSASRARLDQTMNIAHLEGVRVRANGEGNELSLAMTCDQARLDLNTNDFRAEGDVQGTTADGRRFSTPWAVFDQETGEVSTEASVRIVDESGITLSGVGFRYEVRNQRMRLLSDATVVQGP